MGAVSLANVKSTSGVDNYRVVVADVTFSSSYATGGDTVPLGNLGLENVYSIHEHLGTLSVGVNSQSGGFTAANHGLQVQLAGTVLAPLLKVYVGAAGSAAQAASATNLSTVGAVRIEFRGQ